MKVERFVAGIISTNCYLAINENTGQTVIIDPGGCPSHLTSHIKKRGYKIEAILLTHGHFDHIMGIDGFLKEQSSPVYVHEEDQQLMKDPKLNQSSVYTGGYTYEGAVSIHDGQSLSLAGYDFKVLHTPGHTPGGVCYYVESEKILFSGDTLFQNSVGRTDFLLSSMSDLVRGLKEKILTLPEDVIVYPGHMGETTIKQEKKYNPFI